MASFDWKHYFEPTPKLFRKIGDTILAGGTAISSITLISALNVEDEKLQKLLTTVTIVSVVLTFVGKILSNFFKDDTNDTPTT